MAIATSLIGGLGLFLLGMWLMSDGLKLAAGDALRAVLRSWTRSAPRGLAAGLLITAIVQSSSAVTVATIGFVNAGLLSLTQAIWVVFGTNVGTTVTSWLVALVGLKVQIGALALPLIGLGMLLRLLARDRVRRAGLGQALAGFGAFFLGVGVLQDGFTGLAPLIAAQEFDGTGWATVALFVGVGILLTLLTQSSSAAIAVALTATAGGGLPLEIAAAIVIGTGIGTTSTAVFASVGATPPAKRVAMAHIAFALVAAAVALALLPWLLALGNLVGDGVGLDDETPTRVAIFHTLYKCLGLLAIWPLTPLLTRLLARMFVSTSEEISRPKHLDPTLVAVPALALRGLVLELTRMTDIAFDLARQRIGGGATDRRALRLRQDGLLALGQAVRDFIGRLSASTLPPDVVEALPDMVRAMQHLEEIGTLTGDLWGPASAPAASLDGDHWPDLRRAVTASLEPIPGRPRSDGADEPAGDTFAETAGAVETAYQAIKVDLLRRTATGTLHVATMEAALLYARRLRETADAALKARRRLYPWVIRADDHHAPAANKNSEPDR